ncbi:MAG TPA: restriction endonuclease subunit S [Candidatus Pacearchaeota archaeon]|nr:restriction endonuclease subunit S [Candidatus Pacearchaeota archaeon]
MATTSQKIPAGYKQTEIGMIPVDWDCQKITEITESASNSIKIGPFGSALKKEYLSDSGFKVYGQENVYTRDMAVGERFINKNRFNELKSCEIVTGDFLISMMGTVGQCMIVPNGITPGIMDSHLMRIRFDMSKVDQDFIIQLFGTKIISDQIKQLSVGGIMEGLSSKIIKQIWISLPRSKKEQAEIANALSDADSLIKKIEALVEKKKMIKQGAMQELLYGKRRLNGFNEKWTLVPMGNIAQRKQHAIVDGPFGSQMKISEFVNAGIPIIEMEHLENKQSLGESTRFITKQKFDDLKRSAVYTGDIIISKTGTLGLLGVVPSKTIKAIITSRLAKISIDESKANISFVFHWLRQMKVEGHWEKISQGGTMQILGVKMLKDTPIPGISVKEQSVIANILSDMDLEIEKLEERLDKYRAIKQGMMQMLLTGKIRLLTK